MKPGDWLWWRPSGLPRALPVEFIGVDDEFWSAVWVNGVVERVLTMSLHPMHPLEQLALAAE